MSKTNILFNGVPSKASKKGIFNLSLAVRIRLIALILLPMLILTVIASGVDYETDERKEYRSVKDHLSVVSSIIETKFDEGNQRDFELSVFSIGGKRLVKSLTEEFNKLVFLAEFSSSSAIIISYNGKYYYDEKFYIQGANPFQTYEVNDEEKTLFVMPNGSINFCKTVDDEVYSLTNGEKVQYTVMMRMINAAYDNFQRFQPLELS